MKYLTTISDFDKNYRSVCYVEEYYSSWEEAVEACKKYSRSGNTYRVRNMIVNGKLVTSNAEFLAALSKESK